MEDSNRSPWDSDHEENRQSSYPVYGKPQSDWQPSDEAATAEFGATHPLDPYGTPKGGFGESGSTGQMPTQDIPTGAYRPAGTSAAAGAHARAGAAAAAPTPAKKANSDSAVKRFFIAFAGAAVACILVIAIGVGTGLLGKSTVTTLGTSSGETIEVTDGSTELAPAVASKCLPSVVYIEVYTQTTTGYYGSSSSSNSLTESAVGSGVIISADGYIITNYHVIEGSSALKVTTSDGTVYDCDIVGSDESSDIAVIKAKNASGLTAAEIGDSDSLVAGQWVMSIGSPFGLEQSVATGVVSATSRSQIYDSSSDSSSYYSNSGSSSYTLYTNMIQTDAAINPGNSGGALVNQNGQLIGINTLITSYSGNYSGVGFAIPVNYAISLAQQIINGETPTHAQLGVTLSSVTSSNAQRYGLSVSSGAYVSSVSSGSAAEKAGIQQGDIITKFGDKTVSSASDLMLYVREKNPGDTVSIELNRDGQTVTVSATLGNDASSSSSKSGSSNTNQNSGSSSGSGSGSGGFSYGDLYNYFYGGNSGSGSSSTY